ncbi:MAG: OB-fold nucleic acid binding domain-containing protein [bacterium]|nr:OB-fold nucleic acid binding domain-containing protein [bacterium]
MGETQRDVCGAGTERQLPEETLCPSCGKFVGAYERCPYCGTELKKRMSIVFFKRAALVVAIGGLLLLWFTATRLKAPLIKVGEITPGYNNAVVEVSGKVVSARMTQEDGVSFMLDDGTGTVKCQAFRGRRQMRESGNLPHAGDEVSVVGQIQTTDRWGTSIMINVPSNVKVKPVEVHRVAIGDITIEDKTKLVEITGEIVSAREVRGNVFLTVGDTTGVIDVPLWKADLERIKDASYRKEITTVGREIRLAGSVDEYRGKPQVQARDLERIVLLQEDTIPTESIPRWEGARRKEEKIERTMSPAMRRAEEEAGEQPIQTY